MTNKTKTKRARSTVTPRMREIYSTPPIDRTNPEERAMMLFVTVCRALWGPTYQSAAVEDLGISRSSLVRYANGTREIPAEVFAKLADTMKHRAAELAAARKAVDEMAAAA